MKTYSFARASLIVGALLLLGSDFASAYIPSTRTILNRAARSSGKGLYQIEQEVQFRTDGDPIVLRERWIVENGDSMHLTVHGAKGSTEGWKLEVQYADGKRRFADSGGQIKSVGQSAEFIEPYLHFRSGKSILESLLRQRVLPNKLTSMQKRAKSLNGVPFQYETFVRLARTGGVVTYALGAPTAANATKTQPGLWIDQDAFQFRRLRFPSAAEVEADNHFFAAGGIRLPRDRSVTWDNNVVTIRVLTVKSVTATPQIKNLLAGAPNAKTAPPKLPDNPQVREFYQRFR